MSTLSRRIALKTQAVIKSKGVELTLTRTLALPYDPSTGEAETSTPSFPCFGVVQSDTGREHGATENAANTTTQTSRRKVTLAAHGLGLVPKPGDTLGPIEGKTWRVAGVTPEQMNGDPILYVLRVTS